MVDFNNIVIQAESVAIIALLMAMIYFYIKLGLFKMESKPQKKKKAVAAKSEAKK